MYLCRAFLSIIFDTLVSIEIPHNFVTKYLWYILSLLCRHVRVRVARAFPLVIKKASTKALQHYYYLLRKQTPLFQSDKCYIIYIIMRKKGWIENSHFNFLAKLDDFRSN